MVLLDSRLCGHFRVMSFPSLEKRPIEKNPNVLRAHEFLRQSNKLADRSFINAEGKRMLEKMLVQMVAEVQGQYALDEKKAELAKSGKILENLKTTYQTSIGVMEDRFVLADLGRKVQERKLDIHRNYSQCEHLRKATQSTNAEIRREKEVHEKRFTNAKKATDDLKSKSADISILLDNSTDVDQLRKIEEDKRVLEKEVEKLRAGKEYLAEDIKTKTATLKAEAKKSFHKTVIECAKNYTLYKTLTPKLLKSKQNLEKLKEEEDSRRACGSLDETMQFDRSFVQASMEADRSPARSPPKDNRKSLKSPPMSNSLNESIQSIQENHTMDIGEFDEERNTSKNANAATIGTRSSPTTFVQVPVIVPVPQTSKQTSKRHENIVETQRVVPREPSPEPAEEHQEYENRADLSIDLMEIDDGNDNVEPIEQEDQEEREKSPVFKHQLVNDKTVAVVPSQSSESVKSQNKAVVPKPPAPQILDNHGENTNDTAMRLDEEEVMSENGSTRGNNFSFNFFTNNKATNVEDPNGIESDTEGNFDFNFGSIGAGDDGSNNGSGGAFDFLNCGGDGEGQSSNNNVSDPFGFGTCAGGTAGGGDSSFNFNFGADNEGGNDAGAGGNSTSFFNF